MPHSSLMRRWHIATLPLLLACSPFVAPAILAQAPGASPSPFAARWEGTLVAGPNALRLALIVRDSSGSLAGTLISIDQNNAAVPAEVAVRGDTLVVSMMSIGASLTGVLSAPKDSLITTYRQSGAVLPLTLGRASAKGSAP